MSLRVQRQVLRRQVLQSASSDAPLSPGEGLSAVWELTKSCCSVMPGGDEDACFGPQKHVAHVRRL